MANMEEFGFVAIGKAPDYWINKYGTVLNVKGKAIAWNYVKGYAAVMLAVGETGKRTKKTLYIHRLLAEAFVKKPRHWEPNYKVSVKNLDKTDLRLENLQWMNASRSQAHTRGRNGQN